MWASVLDVPAVCWWDNDPPLHNTASVAQKPMHGAFGCQQLQSSSVGLNCRQTLCRRIAVETSHKEATAAGRWGVLVAAIVAVVATAVAATHYHRRRRNTLALR